jgi:hypothetical protein
MRKVRVKVYKFDELNTTIQRKLIDKERESIDTSYIYDDAYQSVKEFHCIFKTKEDYRNWLDVILCYDDNVLELKGLRLHKWLLNNHYTDLFKPVYKKHLEGYRQTIPFIHKIVKWKIIKQGSNKGLYSGCVYSSWKRDNSCVLTGVCYDHSLLDPIYKFIEKPNEETNLKDLIEDCFSSLKKDIEWECDYIQTDKELMKKIMSIMLMEQFI